MRCTCGSLASQGGFQLRKWHRHKRKTGGHVWRIDVSFKCTVCSKVHTYGVPVTREAWERMGKDVVEWREGARRLGIIT